MNAFASAGAFFAAWILIIVTLMVISSTKWGRPVVAYVLWLMIILVVVTHWAAINEILSPQATGIPVQASPTMLTAQPLIGAGY